MNAPAKQATSARARPNAKRNAPTPAAQAIELAPTAPPTPAMAEHAKGAIPTITDEAIRERAYARFEARGRIHGLHHQDWESARLDLLCEAIEAMRTDGT